MVDGLMDYVDRGRFAATAQVLEHLKAQAKNSPPGEWIMARNFDPALQTR